MTQKIIVCAGGQSPWVRDMLRWVVLEKIKELTGEEFEIIPFWHDIDQAWIPQGGDVRWVKSSKGEYASIKLETLPLLVDSVRLSLGIPYSQLKLVGPTSPPIIWSKENEIAQMLCKQLKHVLKVYNMLGGNEFPLPNLGPRPLLKWIENLGGKSPISLFEYFNNPEVQERLRLFIYSGIIKDFWVIKDGQRFKSDLLFSVSEDVILVPRRDGLLKYFTQ